MPINKIVVVGGGSSGWMTAATLIKTFPEKEICVIESKNIPTVGVGESTLGGIKRWTRYIGLDEEDFFKHCDASYKMSIKFTDFYKKDAGAFHYPFGRPMIDGDRNPFVDWHNKKYFYPETPLTDFVDCLFPAAALFNNNKFSLNQFSDFDSYNPYKDVAYHFDATKFAAWLRDRYCVPRGVKHIQAMVTDIVLGEKGVEYLKLDNGLDVYSDIFVDSTGFKSILMNKLGVEFESYSDMLPNNSAWATRIPYKNKDVEMEPYTNSTAIDNGWCWNIPLWSRIGAGYVYSDKFVDKQTALEEFKKYLMSDKMPIPRTKEEVDLLEFKDIQFRVGIFKETFVKNTVAIGLSAGFIEPLESNGLYSVHEFLFKLIDILQRNDINQFDRDMYNSSVRTMFDGFSKFVAMHYSLSHRDDTEYWTAIKNKKFTDWSDDMYGANITKSSGFYDMAYRYLENWSHPLGDAGITYIATGMNVLMTNDSRYDSNAFNSTEDIYAVTNQIANAWEYRKAKWNRNAENVPLLCDYLHEKFYSDQGDVI